MNRRRLLFGVASAGGIALFGCGGSDMTNRPDSDVTLPDVQSLIWDPTPWLWFTAGESRSVDLVLTLPPEVVRGGVFALADGSAPLPPGFALSRAGLLTATNSVEGKVTGVLFTYSF